jgi:L-alanine-DL-glutamate epimerase-like enolase superfamily enzyme
LHTFSPLINWYTLNPEQTVAWVSEAAQLPENRGFDGEGPDIIPGLSAINIALWDLLGHCLHQPLCRLINKNNQCRSSLPAYASLELEYTLSGPSDKLKEHLTKTCEKGFTAIKLYLPRFGYRTEKLTTQQWDELEASYLIQAREIVGPIDFQKSIFRIFNHTINHA